MGEAIFFNYRISETYQVIEKLKGLQRWDEGRWGDPKIRVLT